VGRSIRRRHSHSLVRSAIPFAADECGGSGYVGGDDCELRGYKYRGAESMNDDDLEALVALGMCILVPFLLVTSAVLLVKWAELLCGFVRL
jgi:hypothetical protein